MLRARRFGGQVEPRQGRRRRGIERARMLADRAALGKRVVRSRWEAARFLGGPRFADGMSGVKGLDVLGPVAA